MAHHSKDRDKPKGWKYPEYAKAAAAGRERPVLANFRWPEGPFRPVAPGKCPSTVRVLPRSTELSSRTRESSAHAAPPAERAAARRRGLTSRAFSAAARIGMGASVQDSINFANFLVGAERPWPGVLRACYQWRVARRFGIIVRDQPYVYQGHGAEKVIDMSLRGLPQTTFLLCSASSGA